MKNTYSSFLRQCRSGIEAEVLLGSPKYEDCRDLGICKVYTESLRRTCDCQHWVSAYLRVDAPTLRLLLHIRAASISDSTRDIFFPTSGFVVQHPYRLKTSLIDQLGLEGEEILIAPGNYPILAVDDFTLLSLRLVGVTDSRQLNELQLAA